MSMPNFSRGDVVLVRYPVSDLTSAKVRPAVVVSSPAAQYDDVFVVPVTSQTESLAEGEFVLSAWATAGLNVASAVKRGILLVETTGILKKVGELTERDWTSLQESVQRWLGPPVAFHSR